MFRIANIDENIPLALYLSPITTKTILTALEEWTEDTESIYKYYFSSLSSHFDSPYFEKISYYIPLASKSGKIVSLNGEKVSDDDIVGKEILCRKLQRMKEKMLDPDHYYTFDLFEEYLFSLLIETMRDKALGIKLGLDKIDDDTMEDMLDILDDIASSGEIPAEMKALFDSFKDDELDDDDCDEELTEEEARVAEELQSSFHLTKEAATITSLQIHRIDEMPLYGEEIYDYEDHLYTSEDVYPYEDSYTDEKNDADEDAASRIDQLPNLFFWDDDYDFFFYENTFVEGMKKLASPYGLMLGYSYEDVTEIFTDIGIKPPLLLIGTKTASEERGKVAEEIWRDEMDKVLPDIPNDGELPFS